MRTSTVTKAAQTLNGISIAYVMGVANAGFALLTAYGLTLTQSETAATLAFLNAVLILASHFAHRVGEATASGSATAHSQADSSSSSSSSSPTKSGGGTA